MYGRGRMGYAGRRRFGGPRSPVAVAALVLGALFLISAAGHAFYLLHFLPFILLLWVAFSVVGPMIRVSVGRSSEVSESRERGALAEEDKERQLLEALERCGELSPARTALETTLSVSEADLMLSDLAKDGHLEVRAREGRLAYSLWDRDRREKKELTDGS